MKNKITILGGVITKVQVKEDADEVVIIFRDVEGEQLELYLGNEYYGLIECTVYSNRTEVVLPIELFTGSRIHFRLVMENGYSSFFHIVYDKEKSFAFSVYDQVVVGNVLPGRNYEYYENDDPEPEPDPPEPPEPTNIIRSKTFTSAEEAEPYVGCLSYYNVNGETHEAWKAFDGDENTFWSPSQNAIFFYQYVLYDFGELVANAQIHLLFESYKTNDRTYFTFVMQGSMTSGEHVWEDISERMIPEDGVVTMDFTVTNGKKYAAFRIFGKSGMSWDQYYQGNHREYRFMLIEFAIVGEKEEE